MKKKRESYARFLGYKKMIRVMKLTILLLISGIMAVSANTYSQVTKVSLDVRNVTLAELFEQIEAQSDFYFFYKNDEVTNIKKVDVNVNEVSIEKILNDVLEGSDLKYKVVDRYIVISPDSKLLERTDSYVAQPESISGIVTDNAGDPLPGVTILIKGTTNGTVTNIDGKYTLTNLPEGATLVFSFVGMLTQEIEIGTQTSINITMIADAIGIEEVVAVGYGTQKKVNLTGSIAVIDESTLQNRPVTNVSTAMQGLSPGVVVTSTNGKPGAGSRITVRGNTSVNGNPLLVLIDGVEGTLNSVNPDDIANMTVLKDAASAAIYGSRAAGGVILITTKNAKSEKTQFSYSNNFAVRTPTRMPQTNSGLEHATLWNAAYASVGKIGYSDAHIAAIKDPNVSVIPVEAGATVAFASLDNWLHASDVNWLGMMFDQSNYQSHNLSIAKAGDVNYRISLGYVDDGGFFEKWAPDSYKRINGRVNIETDIIDKILSLDVKLAYANENTAGNNIDVNNIYRTPPTMPVKDTNGNYLRYRMQGNAIQEANERGENSTINNRFDGNFKLTLKILDGLTFTSLNGGRFNFQQINNYVNFVAKWMADGSMRAQPSPSNYSVTRYSTQYNYMSTQNYVTFDKAFADSHKVTVMLGQSAESAKNNQLYAWRNEIVGSNILPALNLGNADNARNGNTLYEWALASYFGRLNYNYQEKYLFEANFRSDASSRFSDKNQRVLFPSFSAAWRLSEEEFVKNWDVFQNLKLRASWGQMGNQSGLGYYDHIPVYSFSGTYPMGDNLVQWATQNKLASADRTWETIETTNFGIDMQVLNNRLNFTADYYTKKNKDMLISTVVPSVIGITVPTGNYGTLEVKGWEVAVSWNDKIGEEFKYGLQFNLSDQKDELVNYNVTDFSRGMMYVQGYPMASVFGYKTDGYFLTDEEAQNHAYINANASAGDIKYLDLNDDDKITSPDDVVYLGETSPHYVWGFGINAQYKNFDFQALFQGVGKRMISINQESGDPNLINQTQNGWDNYSYTYHNDYWTIDNTDARFPRPTVGQRYNYWYSDHWLEDGAYLRLKNIQLGYSLPSNVLNFAHIDNCRFYVSGENVFEFTKLLDAFDPEIGNGRAGSIIYPLKRTYSIGVNIQF
uniref:TonB-dependent receptor n=1 Tax=uncultured Draconibacterium sp. TaxID=1573823 RepID=UPI0032177BC2